MHRRAGKEAAKAVGLAALAALMLAPFIAPLLPRGGGESVNIKEIPELLSRAVALLNSSTLGLAKSVRGGDPVDVEEEAEELAKALARLSEEDLGEGALAEKLYRALPSYASLAEAAYRASRASKLIKEAYPSLREALDAAVRCDPDEAAKAWEKARDAVEKARKELTLASLALASVDPDSLVSERHEEIYETACEVVEEVLASLLEVSKALGLVSKYQDDYRSLCAGGEACTGLKEGLASLRPCRAGPFAYEVGVIRGRALGELSPCRGSGTGSSSGRGGGAGRVEPPSDD